MNTSTKKSVLLVIMLLSTTLAVSKEESCDEIGFSPNFCNPEYMRKNEEQRLEKIELHLEKLLDKCSSLIGVQPEDDENGVQLKRGMYSTRIIYMIGGSYEDRLNSQPSYLLGRFKKCTNYLLKTPENFNSFEYENKSIDNEAKNIEKIYEQVYLCARSNRYLHKLLLPLIPKSLVRKHADKSGLTEFIFRQERKNKKYLSHSKLAEQYFGSKKKWQQQVLKFLDTTYKCNDDK